jgi:hypothetical protein
MEVARVCMLIFLIDPLGCINRSPVIAFPDLTNQHTRPDCVHLRRIKPYSYPSPRLIWTEWQFLRASRRLVLLTRTTSQSEEVIAQNLCIWNWTALVAIIWTCCIVGLLEWLCPNGRSYSNWHDAVLVSPDVAMPDFLWTLQVLSLFLYAFGDH